MPPWWLLGIGFTHVQILSQYAGSGLFHGMAGLPVSTDVAWFVGMGANILVLLACGAVFRGPRLDRLKRLLAPSIILNIVGFCSLYGRQGSRRMTILWLCWEQLLWEWVRPSCFFCGPTCSIEPKSKRRRLRCPFPRLSFSPMPLLSLCCRQVSTAFRCLWLHWRRGRPSTFPFRGCRWHRHARRQSP